MKIFQLPCRAVLAFGLALAAVQTASAGPQDYQFQVVEPRLQHGEDVNVTIAVTDLRTQSPVIGGTIISALMDMSPDGMAGMRSPATPVSGRTPGYYSFIVDLKMAGNWRLAVAARLPGESEIIWREVVVQVAP